MASGGRTDICLKLINSRRAVVNVCKCDAGECENLWLENASLKENLRKIELKDEELLHSREDDMARSLVEPNIKVVNGSFEMPVPLKAELTETLPDNYELALKRTLSLRTSALKNPVLNTRSLTRFLNLPKKDGSRVSIMYTLSCRNGTYQWRSVTFQIRHAVMMTSSVLMTSLIIRQ